jgi:hypothetical protein
MEFHGVSIQNRYSFELFIIKNFLDFLCVHSSPLKRAHQNTNLKCPFVFGPNGRMLDEPVRVDLEVEGAQRYRRLVRRKSPYLAAIKYF